MLNCVLVEPSCEAALMARTRRAPIGMRCVNVWLLSFDILTCQKASIPSSSSLPRRIVGRLSMPWYLLDLFVYYTVVAYCSYVKRVCVVV